MGQYYKAVILEEDKRTVKNFNMSNGSLKLTEHSWLKNPFVKNFESQLINNPQRVVWAGDYAEKRKKQDKNTYNLCNEENILKIKGYSKVKDRYLVNHSKKCYVDKKAVPNKDGWQIHPLPLLTCEGNGDGGGDYFGEDKQKLVGSWARDLISLETQIPNGYKEIKFDLIE